MTTLYLSPAATMVQQFTNVGVPLAGGLLYVYQAGTTSTQTSYTDATGTTANANPITLVSGGRLPSGTSIWVAANTPHKIVITDASGNQLLGGSAFDNLYGINDPTSVQNLLLPPTGVTTGTGADLVANAVKSYSTFTNLRAFGAPSPIYSGQTLICVVQGGTAVGDGYGGMFYWSATSSASDDGKDTIKPTGVVGNGRWLRVPITSAELTYGTFTGTLTGYAAGISVPCSYYNQFFFAGSTSLGLTITTVLVGNNAVSYTGTSNATTMTLTGTPVGIAPGAPYPRFVLELVDNGTWKYGSAQWSAGVFTFSNGPAQGGTFTAFTNSGTKGINSFAMTYSLA